MQFYAVKLRELAKIEGICENCSWNEMKKKKKWFPQILVLIMVFPREQWWGGGVAALVWSKCNFFKFLRKYIWIFFFLQNEKSRWIMNSWRWQRPVACPSGNKRQINLKICRPATWWCHLKLQAIAASAHVVDLVGEEAEAAASLVHRLDRLVTVAQTQSASQC